MGSKKKQKKRKADGGQRQSAVSPAQSSQSLGGKSAVSHAQPSQSVGGQSAVFSGQPSQSLEGGSAVSSDQPSQSLGGQSVVCPAQPSQSLGGQSAVSPAQPSQSLEGQSPVSSDQPSQSLEGESAMSPAQPSQSQATKEVSTPARMPIGFNVDDFLFSKLFKSVNVEGKRTINEVVRTFFCKRMENSSFDTVQHIFDEPSMRKKASSIITKYKHMLEKLQKNILEEKSPIADFDITCGINLLQHIFCHEYHSLPKQCLAQINSLRQLRNTLSHSYPLVARDNNNEEQNEKLNKLLEENEEYVTLLTEISNLEENRNTLNPSAEINKIQEVIDVKRKEIYVVIEIEKLRIVLNDILQNVSNITETNFTNLKKIVNENLTEIMRAKVQEYDQNTYDKEIKRFKDDFMHELIIKGREELKKQYSSLKMANPCPWIIMDDTERSALNNFSIEKIYTPLRIENSRKEISTEDLLVLERGNKKKAAGAFSRILFGLAGSGKTSLCLHFLHHWTTGTNEIKTLQDYNLVIYVELRKVKSCTIVSYLKEQRMKKSTDNIAAEDLVQQLDNLRLLFLIDGYDEAKKQGREVVMDIFAKFPEQVILVTTRKEFREEVRLIASKYNVRFEILEICGFDPSITAEFTERVFDAVMNSKAYFNTQTSKIRTSKDFLSYVEKRGGILQKHLELPLTLALMIYMWIDCPEILNSVTTCTSLYYELYKLCQKKIKNRLDLFCSDSDLDKLLVLVGRLAWYRLLNDEESLSPDDEKEINYECRKRKVPRKELLSAFLMYDCDDEDKDFYSFVHRTQMEYLSAYFWAEAAENVHDIIRSATSLLQFHQVILFYIGHLTRKQMLDQKLKEVFILIDEAAVEENNFNFWWKLLTESQREGVPSRKLACEIIHQKLISRKWKLSRETVVSGLQLLITTPAQIEELIIDIEDCFDPYSVRDFPSLMNSLGTELRGRYGKKNPIITELFFWHHCSRSCEKPSNALLKTLYPWGHLRDFAGSLGEYDEHFMLNYCFKVKNLRVRIQTKDAQVSLCRSLKIISKNIRYLRVILTVKQKDCDPDQLECLTCEKFSGKLEVTLPDMENEDKNWIVQVVKKISGIHGCFKLTFQRSALSHSAVLYIMEKLRDVVHEKYYIESPEELTDDKLKKLLIQQKRVHVEVVWN